MASDGGFVLLEQVVFLAAHVAQVAVNVFDGDIAADQSGGNPQQGHGKQAGRQIQQIHAGCGNEQAALQQFGHAHKHIADGLNVACQAGHDFALAQGLDVAQIAVHDLLEQTREQVVDQMVAQAG